MLSDDQVRYCSANPNAGETLTVNYLRHFLPSGVLLANYFIPNPPGTLEVDVVVINRNGVYLLEVKHWYGPIKADSVRWRHSSGALHRSPIPIIEYKARRLQGILRSRGWHKVSTVGMVVLSNGVDALDIDDANAHKVFGLHESLIKALIGREYVHNPKYPILSNQQVHDLSATILTTHVTDAEELVCGYRVLSKRAHATYIELVAQDLEFSQRRVRIKQYDVPVIQSTQDLEDSVRRFKREMDALVKAGPHLNLITPHRFQRHESSDERYYLILEWIGDNTLTGRIAEGPIEVDEQREILSDVAAALAHCHAHGVYHRNLSPASVYLVPTSRAKVGDFDFARVPSVSQTLSVTTKGLMTGRHLAPEQTAFAPDTDQRADMFALGAIWYDMLFRPTPDDFLDRSRIAKAPLSQDGKDLLTMLVAERRSERPQSMRQVQESLALLK